MTCNASGCRLSQILNCKSFLTERETEEASHAVAAPGGVWNAELAKDRHETVHWIWDGILASGAMTLLTGSVRREKMRPLSRTLLLAMHSRSPLLSTAPVARGFFSSCLLFPQSLTHFVDGGLLCRVGNG